MPAFMPAPPTKNACLLSCLHRQTGATLCGVLLDAQTSVRGVNGASDATLACFQAAATAANGTQCAC